MATKFMRKKETRRPPRRPDLPFQRALIRLSSSPKRRLFLLYVFAAAFLLCAALFEQFGPWAKPVPTAPHRARGVVRDKVTRVENGAERCFLNIEVEVDGSSPVLGEVALDRTFWEAFQPGDYVAVFYEKDAVSGAIRLVECGLFALDSPMR